MTGKQRISELEDHLGYWLRFVSSHVSNSFRHKVEAQGVTVSEWVMLREAYRLGPSSPSALVQALGMSKGAVSKLIDRLQAKQLMTRSVAQQDRRQHSVELTPGGRALVPLLARLADVNDAEFFGHMSPRLRGEVQRAMQDIVRMQQLKAVPID